MLGLVFELKQDIFPYMSNNMIFTVIFIYKNTVYQKKICWIKLISVDQWVQHWVSGLVYASGKHEGLSLSLTSAIICTHALILRDIIPLHVKVAEENQRKLKMQNRPFPSQLLMKSEMLMGMWVLTAKTFSLSEDQNWKGCRCLQQLSQLIAAVNTESLLYIQCLI